MGYLFKLLITLLIGAVGGISAKKLKVIPAAYMLGALFFIVVFNLATGQAYYPNELRIITQIIAGTYLGMRVEKENLSSIKTMANAIAMIMGMYAVLALFFGYLLHRLCGVELLTSLYCFAPGGISDLGIIADSMGCDVGMITFMQLVRLVTVFLFYPFLFKLFEEKHIIETGRNGGASLGAAHSASWKQAMPLKLKARGLGVTFAFTVAAGISGYFLKVPAGPLVFAMAAAIAVNVTYKYAYMPVILRYGAQVMSGIYLGLKITWDSIDAIMSSPVPVLLMVFSVIVLPPINGYLLHKATGHDLATSLFCCTPGGMTEMTLLADDMGLNVVKVSITHICRMVITILFFPYLFQFFILLAGA